MTLCAVWPRETQWEAPASAGAFHQMEDRRTVQRRRVLKAGTIAFGQAAGIDCIVKNLSDQGALLVVESSVGVPNQFTLAIPSEAMKRNAMVQWRRATSIGVSFFA